jgi:uncharacterized membrane protein
MLDTLTLILCIGAGTVGGVFFAFSTFVMQALAQLPASQGIAAMQRINVTVLNPLFLGVFMGTALLALAAAVLAFLPWGAPRSTWLLASGMVYLFGSFLVTVAFNVPRNEQLSRLDAQSAEAATYWSRYLLEWMRWNHVRTAASIASAACAAGALFAA